MPEFQTAKHRIMFAHFPMVNPKAGYAKTILSVLDGIFTGKNPTERLDLLVSGHLHRAYFTEKNSKQSVAVDGLRTIPSAKIPFAYFVNEGMRRTYDNSMTFIEAKGDSLVLKLVRLDGSVSKEYKIK